MPLLPLLGLNVSGMCVLRMYPYYVVKIELSIKDRISEYDSEYEVSEIIEVGRVE
jgi:hypothetical protein